MVTVKYSSEMTNHYDVKMSECHSSFEILIISPAQLFRLVKSTVRQSLGLVQLPWRLKSSSKVFGLETGLVDYM